MKKKIKVEKKRKCMKFKLYGTEIPGPHRPWAQSQLYGAEIPGPGPGPIPALGAGPVERSSYPEPFSRLP